MAEKDNEKSKQVENKSSAKKSSTEKKKKVAPGDSLGIAIEAGKPKGAAQPPRLKQFYKEKVLPGLCKELGIQNVMEAPKLTKIVLSICVKDALVNPKVLDSAIDELAAISGQKPTVTKAKKSIAAFKLREGQAIGAIVTLRRDRMYEFFDRLVNVALPRVRDFKGVSAKSFDGRGNYSMGLKEQIIFPEINYDKIEKIRGMNITIATSTKSNDHARSLLTHLGMPFKK